MSKISNHTDDPDIFGVVNRFCSVGKYFRMPDAQHVINNGMTEDVERKQRQR